MEYPLISIVIPVYNTAKYLDRCIKSILQQHYDNFELILIDDCSSDNSRTICEEYKSHDFRIKFLINKENGGVSFTRNKGLKEAKGRYVTFIDSDDWIDNTYLSDFFLQPILENSITIQGIFYEFKDNKRKTLFSYPNKSYDIYSLNNGVVDNELFHNGCPVAKLFEMRIINDNNILFNESISLNEDHLFVLEYYKYVEHINLISSMNYHYWFNYFEVSLTKKIHGFNQLMTASQEFLDVLPVLINKYTILDNEYQCKLYTSCGINQMFTALINSYSTNEKYLSFNTRFTCFVERNELISTYYFPNEISLKISKFIVLNYNTKINSVLFFIIASLLHMRTKTIRLVKTFIRCFVS